MIPEHDLYIHDADRAAMAALKAIPGFSQVMKALMNVWSERQFKLANMSTNLRLGDAQLKKYHDMLIPICEKLGIDVPELYVELNVVPNAYTYGDTQPFIVLTSGLLDTMPDELIPTVLAHECGHIVCRHTLYHSMGRMLLDGAATFIGGLANIALKPIQLAFAYWMRCSEYSADRVAAVCDGTSDRVVEMCMRFAGGARASGDEACVEAFLDQAREYRQLVSSNAVNRTMEFLMFNGMSHPLNAVRALESREWGGSDRFRVIMDIMSASPDSDPARLPARFSPRKLIGRDAMEVAEELANAGYTEVSFVRVTQGAGKPGTVVACTAARGEDWYTKDEPIRVEYLRPLSESELAAPGRIRMPEDARVYIGRPFTDAQTALRGLGFRNIALHETPLPRFAVTERKYCLASVVIGGRKGFAKGDVFDRDDVAELTYYAEE